MEPRFVDREDELRLLRDGLSRKGAALFVLWGRRRIGKTSLLEELLRDRPSAAYHVATRSTIAEELGRLSITLASAWRLPVLAAQPLRSTDAFLALLESAPRGATLVLDELPYLVESDPSLPGRLQAAWDSTLSRRDIKLVVCGSSIAMMERLFEDARAPLYGRRTGQLRLGPIATEHLGPFFRAEPTQLVELAAAFGGVPGVLVRLDGTAGLRENLARRVLARGEPLYEEVPFLLREELREPRVYHAILAAIASGARKFGEITSKVGLDGGNLSSYLANLVELGLVEREVPVTERHPHKSRKGLHRIADPFVATWFTFVHPNRDLLERGRVDEVLATRVDPALPTWLSRAVEPVVVELLRSPVLEDVVPFPVGYAGRHWDPHTELDAVLLDAERRRAMVVEVKWGATAAPRGLLDDLRARVTRVAALAGLEITFALVSKSGFQGRRALRSDERLVDARRLPLLRRRQT